MAQGVKHTAVRCQTIMQCNQWLQKNKL